MFTDILMQLFYDIIINNTFWTDITITRQNQETQTQRFITEKSKVYNIKTIFVIKSIVKEIAN